METKDAIFGRRSIKKYKPIPVEYDKVVDIVEAGMEAPSAGNLHLCKYIVVIEQDKREQIAEACLTQMWMAQAPVHIVVCAETDKSVQMHGIRGERLYTVQDCAASIQNMLLRAYDLGLGTCWVGAFDEDILKRLCNIPGNIRPQAVITIGYPDEAPKKQETYPLSHMFYFENWGGGLRNIHRIFHQHSVEMANIGRAIKDKVKKVIKK